MAAQPRIGAGDVARRLDRSGGDTVDAHIPVLLEETITALAPRADGFYVDATFGRGGHTARLLGALGPQGRVLALDRDAEAVAWGRARFADEPRLTIVHAAFAELATALREHASGRAPVGVLFDLGVSSPQLDVAERGFSFTRDGPLDMRMDATRGETAADWLARASVDEIRKVIEEFGEERFARRVAQAIDASRRETPITRTAQLAAIVERAVRTREPGKHPATRTFQALRMRVNDELEQITRGLEVAHDWLAPGGRLAVISFHSLEDRLVKRFMRQRASVDPVWAGLPEVPPHARPTLKLVGRKIRAGAPEIAANPRARSAVLRVAERLAAAESRQ